MLIWFIEWRSCVEKADFLVMHMLPNSPDLQNPSPAFAYVRSLF